MYNGLDRSSISSLVFVEQFQFSLNALGQTPNTKYLDIRSSFYNVS
jgi:hypothetical protein